MTIEDAPEVLTVSEAAAILRIGRNQLYEAIQRGDVYAARLGRSLRVPKASLLRLLGAGPPGPTPDTEAGVTPAATPPPKS